jgi:hypothetical protein
MITANDQGDICLVSLSSELWCSSASSNLEFTKVNVDIKSVAIDGDWLCVLFNSGDVQCTHQTKQGVVRQVSWKAGQSEKKTPVEIPNPQHIVVSGNAMCILDASLYVFCTTNWTNAKSNWVKKHEQLKSITLRDHTLCGVNQFNQVTCYRRFDSSYWPFYYFKNEYVLQVTWNSLGDLDLVNTRRQHSSKVNQFELMHTPR